MPQWLAVIRFCKQPVPDGKLSGSIGPFSRICMHFSCMSSPFMSMHLSTLMSNPVDRNLPAKLKVCPRSLVHDFQDSSVKSKCEVLISMHLKSALEILPSAYLC